MMMETYFTTHFKGVHVLFKGWEITTVGALVASVGIVFVLAFIFEIFKAYLSSYYSCPESSEEDETLLGNNSSNDAIIITHFPRFDLKKNLIKTFFFTFNLIYGYFLMLIAMTFNVWLFLALVIGYGLGYWFSVPHFESPLPSKKKSVPKSYGTLTNSLATL